MSTTHQTDNEALERIEAARAVIAAHYNESPDTAIKQAKDGITRTIFQFLIQPSSSIELHSLHHEFDQMFMLYNFLDDIDYYCTSGI